MIWPFGKVILDEGKPEPLKAVHQSNIFCLGITSDNQKVFSGGNDDIVSIILLFFKDWDDYYIHFSDVDGLRDSFW